MKENNQGEWIAGNKLIAEFDGWYQKPEVNKGSDINWFHEKYSEKVTKSLSLPMRPQHFKYHSSWDWLMPVVEKIQSIDITPPPNYSGYRIEILVQGYVKINGFPMPPIFTNVSIEGSLIKAVWEAVIQFITWYNSQLKSKLT